MARWQPVWGHVVSPVRNNRPKTQMMAQTNGFIHQCLCTKSPVPLGESAKVAGKRAPPPDFKSTQLLGGRRASIMHAQRFSITEQPCPTIDAKSPQNCTPVSSSCCVRLRRRPQALISS